MTADPHWTTALSALAMATVAMIGAFIAWNLWRTNRDIRRERLFDRRFVLFRDTQDLIAAIREKGRIDWERAGRFQDIAQRARFMVSDEDARYFDLLREKAMELAEVTAATEGSAPAKVMDASGRRREICAWFDEQDEEVFSRMCPYLSFGS